MQASQLSLVRSFIRSAVLDGWRIIIVTWIKPSEPVTSCLRTVGEWRVELQCINGDDAMRATAIFPCQCIETVKITPDCTLLAFPNRNNWARFTGAL